MKECKYGGYCSFSNDNIHLPCSICKGKKFRVTKRNPAVKLLLRRNARLGSNPGGVERGEHASPAHKAEKARRVVK